MSVGSRSSAIGVPATTDWPTCARPVETIPAIGAKGRKLNRGLGDFRLLRDNCLAGRGLFAQDFHAESDGGRHSVDTFCCFLGHAHIGARRFKRIPSGTSLDAQFCRTTGDVRQCAHISCDNAVLLRRTHLSDLFAGLDRAPATRLMWLTCTV